MSQNEQAKKEEKVSFSDKLSQFLVKFRFLFLGIILALLVAVALVLVISSVTTKKVQTGLTEIDSITYELSEARSVLKDAELTAKESALFERAKAVADANSKGVVAVRAKMLMAEIAFAKADYSNACQYWLDAVNANTKAYTAGICYYQCGVCSEEMGDLDSAVKYLQTAADTENFVAAPRALFNIGRIEETRGNIDKAAEAYKKLSEAFPNDGWTSLAKTRLLNLEINGKL